MESIKKECSAFCPKCGSDLYFLHGICYCKSKNCDYQCNKCSIEKKKLSFSDKTSD